MRCAAYCTAVSYNIDAIVKQLIENGLEPKYFDDVIHVSKDSGHEGHIIEIFYFPFGCIIIFGATEPEERGIVEEIEKLANGTVDQVVSDIIYYHYDSNSEENYIDEERNMIVVMDDSIFVKLSISHALAQSVKLNVLRVSIDNLISNTAPMQQELARTGAISMSKNELSKQIGALFNERYSINMHSDILDTPEFFWRRPRYEPLYLMTADFQDIQIRHNILNRRLNIIHELYTILSNELNYMHSTRLEMVVIILITIEVLMGIVEHGIIGKILSILH